MTAGSEAVRSGEAKRQLSLVGIGRGLSHALRIRIVMSLLATRAELSSTDLANRLDTSLGNIDYHVKCLLALGMIESKRAYQGRGSCQHFYALTPSVRDLLATVVEHPLPSQVETSAIRLEHQLGSSLG